MVGVRITKGEQKSETERKKEKKREKKNKAKDIVYNFTKLLAHPTITIYSYTFTEVADRC